MAGRTPTRRVRPPLIAGTFYPRDADDLRAMVDRLLDDGGRRLDETQVAVDRPVRGLIAPHAGYRYSGPVAGTAFAALRRVRQDVSRVVLVGPSHRVSFTGLAAPVDDAFATPLGEVELDHDALATLDRLPQVTRLEEGHAREHALEAHLPFLQRVLGRLTLAPLTFGDTTAEDVAEAMLTLADERTLIAVSSDLSHYEPHGSAAEHDRRTAEAVVSGRGEEVGPYDACGFLAVRGLMQVARRRGWRARCVDLRDSFEAGGGDEGQVVGYGGFLFD